MKHKKHILVVDDDERIRKLLQRFLRKNDYMVSSSSNARDASTLTKSITFDLLIIDVMMPGQDGIALTKCLLRKITTPIILLTAKKDISDRILGLETGADDYISKPFDPRELILRIETILKRVKLESSELKQEKVTKIGDFQYDSYRDELWKDQNLIPLTSAEKSLIKELVKCANNPVERTSLARVLFEGKDSNSKTVSPQNNSIINLKRERGVDVNVNRLRKKIEKNPKFPRYLKTVRGVGYMLIPDWK